MTTSLHGISPEFLQAQRVAVKGHQTLCRTAVTDLVRMKRFTTKRLSNLIALFGLTLLNFSCERTPSSTSALFEKSPAFALATIATNCNTDNANELCKEIKIAILDQLSRGEDRIIEDITSTSGEQFRLIISINEGKGGQYADFDIILKLFQPNDPARQRVKFIRSFSKQVWMVEGDDVTTDITCGDIIGSLQLLATKPNEWFSR